VVQISGGKILRPPEGNVSQTIIIRYIRKSGVYCVRNIEKIVSFPSNEYLITKHTFYPISLHRIPPISLTWNTTGMVCGSQPRWWTKDPASGHFPFSSACMVNVCVISKHLFTFMPKFKPFFKNLNLFSFSFPFAI
jgi:hypothetical protein